VSKRIIDPLDFGDYRFMKPNHEMFCKMENSHNNSFRRLLANRGYVQQNVDPQDSSESSDDEELDQDGIERVDHGHILDWFWGMDGHF